MALDRLKTQLQETGQCGPVNGLTVAELAELVVDLGIDAHAARVKLDGLAYITLAATGDSAEVQRDEPAGNAELKSGAYDYRLRFETVTGLQASEVDALAHSRGVWGHDPGLSDAAWEALPWREAERIVSGDGGDIFDQYRVLTAWAESREQPVRNVRLDRRRRPQPRTDWEPVGNDEL